MKTTTYSHKKGGVYIILNLCQYKHKEKWYAAISYKDVESVKNYVCSEERWEKYFKLSGDE